MNPPGRRIQPAYGRALLDRRRAGDHPDELVLIYGDSWYFRMGALPVIAIRPADYEPGKYDFRVCAGLLVYLIDQNAELLAPSGNVYTLLHEVASCDCALSIRIGDDPRELPVSQIAWCQRVGGRWPSWWSDELDRKEAARMNAWLHHRGRVLGILEDESA